MRIHCVRVAWSTHRAKLSHIRAQVFSDGSTLATDVDVDAEDETADHFLAMNEAGQPIGAARLLNGQIGRVGVLAEHRRRGIGRQLMNAAVEHATTLGLRRVFIHSNRGAEGFCRKVGFRRADARSAQTDLPYLEMTLDLPIPFQSDERSVGLALQKPDGVRAESRPQRLIQFDSEHECRSAALDLLEGARRTVVLLSSALDPQLFATDESIALVSAFARRSRHARMRILVEDTKGIAGNNHALLELARRLPSKILMRRLPLDREPVKGMYMVIDDEAVWVVPDQDAFVGWANHHDRVEARRLSEEFMWLFERGTEDPELRLLSL